MRRALVAIVACSLGALVAPLLHSLPVVLAVHENDADDNLLNLATAEYYSSGIPICTSNASRPDALWVFAQASVAVAPASTSPSVAGEPLRAPPVCSSIE